MRKPTRRHRFAASQRAQFEIQGADESKPIINLPPRDPLAFQTFVEDTKPTSTDAKITLPRLTGKPTGDWEPAPIVVPSGLRLVAAPPATENKPLPALWLGLVSVASLALGVLGNALWSRHAQPAPDFPAPAAIPEAAPLTPAEQEELDAAYAARDAQKFAEAAQRFVILGRKHPGWKAMEVEAGVTLLDEGNLDAAETSLQASADRGWTPAAANYFLGATNLKKKDYARAQESLGKAVALDPSRPEFYYLWGECLREEGKPLEAATKFRSALLRRPSETAEGLYRLKLWLSEIEADQENNDGIAAEVDRAMSQPHPPMEALFAAAARDLKSDDIRAAAGHLLRARERTDPKVFQTILDDPVFAQVRSRPELAEVFKAANVPVPPVARSEPGPVFPTSTFATPADRE